MTTAGRVALTDRSKSHTFLPTLLPALLLALCGVLVAPFMGGLRDWLSDTLGGVFVKGLAAILVLTLVAALAIAIGGIRQHRMWRYGGLVLVVLLVAVQTFLLGRDIADPALALEVNVVEKVHLVQYGLLAILLYRPLRALGNPAMAGFTLLGVTLGGIAEEWIQWLVPLRVGEATDVALNLYAGLLGLVFGLALTPPENFTWKVPRRQRSVLLIGLAAVILAFGGFFHCAHLGAWVEDPEIGRFRSWYPREELLSLRDERAQRWADAPPRLTAIGREDHYLSAAGWHVNHRNHSFQLGHVFVAWQENRILETYFTPFLDLPQRSGEGTYRLPENQLEQLRQQYEEIAERQPRRVGRYVSPVLEQRIVTRPSAGEWWLGVGTLAVVLLIGAWVLGRVNLREDGPGCPNPTSRPLRR